jgi:hypothetical protein
MEDGDAVEGICGNKILNPLSRETAFQWASGARERVGIAVRMLWEDELRNSPPEWRRVVDGGNDHKTGSGSCLVVRQTIKHPRT